MRFQFYCAVALAAISSRSQALRLQEFVECHCQVNSSAAVNSSENSACSETKAQLLKSIQVAADKITEDVTAASASKKKDGEATTKAGDAAKVDVSPKKNASPVVNEGTKVDGKTAVVDKATTAAEDKDDRKAFEENSMKDKKSAEDIKSAKKADTEKKSSKEKSAENESGVAKTTAEKELDSLKGYDAMQNAVDGATCEISTYAKRGMQKVNKLLQQKTSEIASSSKESGQTPSCGVLFPDDDTKRYVKASKAI